MSSRSRRGPVDRAGPAGRVVGLVWVGLGAGAFGFGLEVGGLVGQSFAAQDLRGGDAGGGVVLHGTVGVAVPVRVGGHDDPLRVSEVPSGMLEAANAES
jgi:hypothetical protein